MQQVKYSQDADSLFTKKNKNNLTYFLKSIKAIRGNIGIFAVDSVFPINSFMIVRPPTMSTYFIWRTRHPTVNNPRGSAPEQEGDCWAVKEVFKSCGFRGI